MKKNLSFTSFFAGCILLAVSLQPTDVLAGEQKPWEARGLSNELQAMRSRTSKHFFNANGSVTGFMAAGSIHYRDAAGQWADISTDIVSFAGGSGLTYPYAATENAVKTFFPADPSKDALLMKTAHGDITEKINDIRIVDGSGAVLSTLKLGSPSNVIVSGNKIAYVDVLTGADLVYSLGNDGRKFELVLKSASFLSLIPANAAAIVIGETLSAPGSVTAKKDGYTAVMLNGVEVLGIQEAFAFDASGNEPANALIETTAGSEGIQVNTSFSVQWISSSERAFPIHLDPTVNYFPQNVQWWTGYQTASTNRTNGIIRLAAAGTTAWAKFDISTLPGAAIVQQATYYGYHYTTNSGTKFAEARSMTVDPVPATSAQIYAEATGGSMYNTSWLFGTTTYSWQNCALGGTAISDLMAAKTQSWFAVGFQYESGLTTFMYHYGYNGTNPPYLEVTYVTTPCTGTPPGNAIISPTYQLCSGESFMFQLDSLYSVSGLTYQWEASTTSSVGPYTAISGATLEAYQASNITQNTWYNLVVTCSNSTGSVLVTGGVASVQPVVTHTAPYFESFETIGMPNRLPNCSWAAPNLGVSAETFVSASTNNLLPRTGSGFAAFTNPGGGEDYYYTNGIYLVPGVNYSVSLWYQTDLSGGVNWTDLSILLGTSQATTGLVSLASTNGPATSIIYKSLSGTFTVAAPGLYHVAVRATSSAGTSQNLAWDDLRIEIPCSLNTPTLNIIASNTTVCAGSDVILTAVGADTYVWSNNLGGANAVTVTPFYSTLYSVNGTSSLSGCAASASQYINVNPSPMISVINTPPVVCAGKQLTLHAFGADLYSWSTGDNGNVTTVVAPATSTAYVVQGTNQYNCSASYTHQVNVLPAPVLLLDVPASACIGDMVSFSASGANTFTWMANNIFVTDNPAIVYPTGSNNYTVTGSDANGCTTSQVFQLIVNDCVGIAEQASKKFTLYPNPTDGLLFIKMAGGEEVRAVMSDVSGRIIAEKNDAGTVTFDMHELAAGIYYVEIYSGEGADRVKVIRQ